MMTTLAQNHLTPLTTLPVNSAANVSTQQYDPLPLTTIAKKLTQILLEQTRIPDYLQKYGPLLLAMTSGAAAASGIFWYYQKYKISQERIQHFMLHILLRIEQSSDYQTDLRDPARLIASVEDDVMRELENHTTENERKSIIVGLKRKFHERADEEEQRLQFEKRLNQRAAAYAANRSLRAGLGNQVHISHEHGDYQDTAMVDGDDAQGSNPRTPRISCGSASRSRSSSRIKKLTEISEGDSLEVCPSDASSSEIANEERLTCEAPEAKSNLLSGEPVSQYDEKSGPGDISEETPEEVEIDKGYYADAFSDSEEATGDDEDDEEESSLPESAAGGFVSELPTGPFVDSPSETGDPPRMVRSRSSEYTPTFKACSTLSANELLSTSTPKSNQPEHIEIESLPKKIGEHVMPPPFEVEQPSSLESESKPEQAPADISTVSIPVQTAPEPATTWPRKSQRNTTTPSRYWP